jgi:hypothetical protein
MEQLPNAGMEGGVLRDGHGFLHSPEGLNYGLTVREENSGEDDETMTR